MNLNQFFENVHERTSGERRNFLVRFYPYASLKHTIRDRDGSIAVRLSDACRDAPQDVLEAIAAILIAKLRGRKIPQEQWKIYRSFAASDEMQARVEELRRERGWRVLNGSTGKCYDLEEVFERLNKLYFNSELQKPKLSWSEKRARRVLGQYDAALNVIVVSRALDCSRVPNYVLDCVVYHEMLHIKHSITNDNGRRRVHSKAFKQDEKRFERYGEAKTWMRRGVR